MLEIFPSCPIKNLAYDARALARVVEWQTRAFKGRMPKGMRVRVPPRAGRSLTPI